jgi:hypothetical protein
VKRNVLRKIWAGSAYIVCICQGNLILKYVNIMDGKSVYLGYFMFID